MRMTARLTRRLIAMALGLLTLIAIGCVLLASTGPDGATAATPGDLDSYILNAEAPVEQRAALADGFVTHEEHEGAIQRAIACATEAGVRMQTAPGDGLRPTRLGFVSQNEEEMRSSQAKLGACVEKYLSVIEGVRAAQPVGPHTIEEATTLLADCMNDRLSDGRVSSSTVRGEIDRLMAKPSRDDREWGMLRAWDECRFVAEAQTGFLP